MHPEGYLAKSLLLRVFVMAGMFQGCSTHSHDVTENQIRVNQDQANAWRRHGDENVAASFEERNRKIAEDEAGYGLTDLLIDIVFSD